MTLSIIDGIHPRPTSAGLSSHPRQPPPLGFAEARRDEVSGAYPLSGRGIR